MVIDWIALGTLIGVPAARSVVGWLENAFDDGKISEFEWGQLGATILRVGIIGLGTYFGLNGFGIDVDALGAAGSAVVVDFILASMKKTK
jgi:hypothetical protein